MQVKVQYACLVRSLWHPVRLPMNCCRLLLILASSLRAICSNSRSVAAYRTSSIWMLLCCHTTIPCLQSNVVLEVLLMAGNDIGEDGARHLMTALAANNSLKFLGLNGSNLTGRE
eukprot:GHUV01054769.1.p1 GENE.GHUV01054769.1~~GHUV01054769.1.p1  ORF type:complete len:115 (-),score=0.22 GHUV01054769.1:155-499(-)